MRKWIIEIISFIAAIMAFIGIAIWYDRPPKIQYHGFYQMVEGDSIYHIESCPILITVEDNEIISNNNRDYFEYEESAMPCNICNPDTYKREHKESKKRIKGYYIGKTEGGSWIYSTKKPK